MINKIKTVIDQILDNKNIKIKDCDTHEIYNMNVSKLILKDGAIESTLDKKELGIFISGYDVNKNENITIKISPYSVVHNKFSLLTDLVKSKPLINVVDNYKMVINNKEYIDRALIILPYQDKNNELTLTKITLFDIEGEIFTSLKKDYDNRIITKVDYLDLYKRYSFKANFKRDEFNIAYMIFNKIYSFTVDYINKNYITKRGIIPFQPYNEDEAELSKNKKDFILLQNLNIKTVSSKTNNRHLYRILGLEKLKLPQKEKIISENNGLFIFKNTYEEDIINTIYKDIKEEVNLTLFTDSVLNRGGYKTDVPNVKIVQLLLDSDKNMSDPKSLYEKCISIIDMIDGIIIPCNSDISLDLILRLSSYTKVYWQFNFDSVRDFISRIDKKYIDRFFAVLKGMGSLPKVSKVV